MPSDKDGFDSRLEGESQNIDEDKWYYVTVYNNEYNTFEEVIYIIQRATCCSYELAEHIAWEIHNQNHANVMIAPYSSAKDAADIIKTIGIKVKLVEEKSITS